MKVFIIIAALVSAVFAQYAPSQNVPIPYSFSYSSNTEDGGNSGHQETSDGSGRVQGSYTVNDLEGHSRVVDYVADEMGFRATVRTNEPGTANINPADVTMESSAADISGVSTYSTGATGLAPPPAHRPAVEPPLPYSREEARYVPVPVTDPRARGYY